jgi:hypothetical protein
MAGKADLVNSIADSVASYPDAASAAYEWQDPAADAGGLDPAGTLPLDPIGGG